MRTHKQWADRARRDGPSGEALAESVGAQTARQTLYPRHYGADLTRGGWPNALHTSTPSLTVSPRNDKSPAMLGNDVVLRVSGLWASRLLSAVLGIGFAARKPRRQRQNTGTVSDWGESFGLVYGLRREISRLRRGIERLQEEQRDLLRIVARVNELLERETRRIR